MNNQAYLQLEKTDTIIWDLDWTVWGSDNMSAFKLICMKMKISFSEELYAQLIEWVGNYQSFFNNQLVTKEGMIECVKHYMPLLEKYHISGKKFLDMWCKDRYIYEIGAGDVLKKLQGKYHQVALTDWFEDAQTDYLNRLKYLEYFERIYAADNSFFKPDLRGIERIFKDYGRMNCIIIGDSLTKDVKLANDTGILSIWLNNQKKELIPGINPTFTVNDISEVLEIL